MKKREIEKKFLIKYPSEALLASILPTDKSHIVQTYLISEKNVTARVRLRKFSDCTKYYKTLKMRISDMSAFEDEREISEAEYISELKNADPQRNSVEKERLLLREGNHVFEIDIYPFWSDRAVMEVELDSEDETFCIPKSIEVILDVTGDRRYKNAALAREIPMDEILK